MKSKEGAKEKESSLWLCNPKPYPYKNKKLRKKIEKAHREASEAAREYFGKGDNNRPINL